MSGASSTAIEPRVMRPPRDCEGAGHPLLATVCCKVVWGPRGEGRRSWALPMEDEVGGADRDAVAVRELGALRAPAVHVGAVRRAEVDDREGVAVAADLGMAPGGVRVGDLDVALARAADDDPAADDLVRPVADGDDRLRLLDAELDRRGGLGRHRGDRLLAVDHRVPRLARGRALGAR